MIFSAVIVAAAVLLPVVYPSMAYAGQTMSATQAHEKATKGEITLVDVRTPGEWAETGLPASAHAITMNQPSPQLFKQLDDALGGDRSKPLAVICRTGNRTGSLVGPLEQAGYTNVIDVSEGMAGSSRGPGWAKTGLPLRKWSAGPASPNASSIPR